MANLREVLDEELAKVPGAPAACVKVKSGRVILQGTATTLQYSFLNVVLHNARKRMGKNFDIDRRIEHVADAEDDTKLVTDTTAHAILMADYVAELMQLVDGNTVVFTGAGISTAAKIPDFRGPNGVWTRRDQGLPRPESVKLEAAVPTYTHRTIVALHAANKINFVVSQNIDGLHLRSGMPRDALSELHGNCFLEKCANCQREYLRLYDVKRNRGPYFSGEVDEASQSGISHITGRKCDDCKGRLRDTIIHFHENLPEKDLDDANRMCRAAGLVLCLGSSMKVTPAADQPFAGHAVVAIVSRQPTGRDGEALATGGVVIHQDCDAFIAHIATRLHVGEPNTPETAAAYNEKFMADTRRQLMQSARPVQSDAPAQPPVPAQAHFFSMLGLPTTMTQLPSHLSVTFTGASPAAGTTESTNTVTATVHAPEAYPVPLHELLARIELQVGGETVATSTTAPFVVASDTIPSVALVQCAIFFQPGHGNASKSPLLATMKAGSNSSSAEVRVPPMTLPTTFVDHLRAPTLRHVETRVTRADGSSYVEAPLRP